MAGESNQLRRKLDALGFDYETEDGHDCAVTFWEGSFGSARFFEDIGGEQGGYTSFELNSQIFGTSNISHEQALNATVNMRTPNSIDDTPIGCEWCENGKSFDGQIAMSTNHGWQRINYCPNCGKRIGGKNG